MVFTAEYEFALRASALAMMIAAWSLTRVAFGQPVLHPWLGALIAGLISAMASIIGVVPGTGPAFDVVTNAAGIVTGLLFSAGVRFEAIHAPVGIKTVSLIASSALVAATIIEIVVRNGPARMALVQMVVGVTILAAVIWVPRLLRRTGPKLGAVCLGLLSVGVALDRATPLIHGLASGPDAFLFPYVLHSDILVIVAGSVAMIVFSVERARRERRAAARQAQRSP